MASKLDKNTLKGIRLNGQIIPSTTDNVQVQARYVQVTPDPVDLGNILGMANVTGSVSGGCANNLYDVLTGVVPYTGATKKVDLGRHTITSAGFALSSGTHSSAIADSTTIINADSNIRLLVDTVDGKNQINLAGLYRTVKLMVDNAKGTTGWAYTLYDHFHNLYDKVNHITNPLRFKGVINSGGKLPTSGVEVGDVWHFNTDVVPYYGGDEVVCTKVVKGVGGTSDVITWEILGQNITPIPDSKITFENLESN